MLFLVPPLFKVITGVSPIVQGRATTTVGSGGSHIYNLPSGIVAGECLLIIAGFDGPTGTLTPPTGFTAFAAGLLTGYYKLNATGSEGATVTDGTGNSPRAGSIAFRISGVTAAPEISSLATGSSTNPAAGTVTPSWGASVNSLNITAFSETTTSSPTVSVTPAGYANTQSTGIGAATRLLASAEKAIKAASESPAAWTITASAAWSAGSVILKGT